MISPPSSSGLGCQVDFFVNKEIDQLQHFEPLRENLQPVLKLLKSFLAILDCNGSIAKHFNTPLFSSKMEAIISESFSCPRPRTVELSDTEGHRGSYLTWGELAREGLSEAQFESCGGGVYHCCFRGTSVEVGKADRDVLCSDFLQRLLQARVDPDDVQKERDSRSRVITDLTRLNEDVLEAENIQRILHTLREQDPSSSDNVPSTDPTSSASLIASPKYNARSGIDSVTHSEAMDGDERNPVQLQHEGMDNTVGESVHSERGANASPPKAASAWTTSEKRQLRTFLATRQHLTWAQVAKEYEQTFQMGRSQSSIVGQARQMGFLPRHKHKKQVTRANRRNLVVLKACIPHNQSESSPTESNAVSNPSPVPSGSPSRKEIAEKGLRQPVQPPVGLNGPTSLLANTAASTTSYPSTGGNPQYRHLGNDPQGSFGWILN